MLGAQAHSPLLAHRGRRRLGALVAGVTLLAVGSLGAPAALADTTTTVSFTSAGPSTFTAPAGVSSIDVTAIGGPGGSCTSGSVGGAGAIVTATVPVTPGEQLVVGVGSAGANCSSTDNTGGAGAIGGGGFGGTGGSPTFSSQMGGAGGGGASLVGPDSSPTWALVVAGGGGGAAGAVANAGANADSSVGAITNGTSPMAGDVGGAGGTTTLDPDNPGQSGTAGAGGDGASNTNNEVGGGGGGGGYWGGGGGAVREPGAGGSSYWVSSATNVGRDVTSDPPSVSITYAVPTADESTGAIAFPGTQPQGVASAERTLTVTNHGSAPLVLSTVQLGGADPGDFLVDNRCQQEVAPSASCQIGVRFSPQAQGARSARLSLVTNAPAQPATVTLSGTGGSLPAGPQGATGPQGPPGPQGPAGQQASSRQPQVEVVSCRHAKRSERCTGRMANGKVRLTRASVRATISRGRRVYAAGTSTATGRGRTRLMLTPRRRLMPGSYTLTLRTRRGRHWIVRHVRIRLT